MAINSVKTLKMKEVNLVVLGFFVPMFLVFVVLFWFDQSQEFFFSHFSFGFTTNIHSVLQNLEFTVKIVTLGLILLISAYLVIYRRMSKVNRFRKTFQAVFIFLIFSIITLLFISHHEVKHWSIIVIPVSMFVAFLFNEFVKSWMAEIVHLVMLIVILFFQVQIFLN